MVNGSDLSLGGEVHVSSDLYRARSFEITIFPWIDT